MWMYKYSSEQRSGVTSGLPTITGSNKIERKVVRAHGPARLVGVHHTPRRQVDVGRREDVTPQGRLLLVYSWHTTAASKQARLSDTCFLGCVYKRCRARPPLSGGPM